MHSTIACVHCLRGASRLGHKGDGRIPTAWRRYSQTPIRFEKVPKSIPLCARSSASTESARHEDGIAVGSLIADVRYESTKRLLLVGEANFTFAAALATAFGDCSSVTATSFEPRSELLERFGEPVKARVAALEEKMCGVYYSIAVADLLSRFRASSFDCIVFNFPLCRPSKPEERGKVWHDADDRVDEEADVTSLQRADHGARAREAYAKLSVVLDEFFRGAAYVLRPGGECHLRLTDQFATARGLRTAHDHGLKFASRLEFSLAFEQVYRPLGYRPSALDVKDGAARSRKRISKAGFSVRNSSTFVFHRSPKSMLAATASM